MKQRKKVSIQVYPGRRYLLKSLYNVLFDCVLLNLTVLEDAKPLLSLFLLTQIGLFR